VGWSKLKHPRHTEFDDTRIQKCKALSSCAIQTMRSFISCMELSARDIAPWLIAQVLTMKLCVLFGHIQYWGVFAHLLTSPNSLRIIPDAHVQGVLSRGEAHWLHRGRLTPRGTLQHFSTASKLSQQWKRSGCFASTAESMR
jgi:hypothetical protein